MTADALIEAVAREIFFGDGGDPTAWDKVRVRELYLSNARAALSAIEAQGFRVVPADLIDKFPEINISNYDEDGVSALNQWGIEVVTLPKLTEGGS